MIRTQIQLEPGQHAALRRLAHRHHLSLSEAVRRMVRQGLLQGLEDEAEGKTGADALLELAGIGRSGLSDLGRRHDEYFAESGDE